MSISAQAFTDGGRTMLGRANNGELLTFDTIVIGAGVAASTAALYPLTALIDHRFNVAITAKVDQGNGILVLDGVINSADIPAGQGFNLCELGLMAHIALEAPALYSVANVLATTPDYIPDAVENPTAVHAFKIKVVIDRATNVTVVLGTSIDILAENIGPALDPNGIAWPGVFHEKLANTLRFKRLTPGTGIEMTEAPADPFNITISQKVLKLDLDLYVPLTNPGGTPETRFDTIQEAIDYLGEFSITTNVMARINIDDSGPTAGRFTYTTPITMNHPQGDQIQILAPDPEVRTITAAGLVTPGVWPAPCSWTVNLDNTGLQVGDAITFRGGEARGHHRITSLPAANQVVFESYNRLPPAVPNLANTDVIVHKVHLKPVGCNALNVSGGLLEISNVSFEGGASGLLSPFLGISGGSSYIGARTCGFNNLYGGISSSQGGSIVAENCFVSDCGYGSGITASGGSYVTIFGGVITACLSNSVNSIGGKVYLYPSNLPVTPVVQTIPYVGFSDVGMSAIQGGSITVVDGIFNLNRVGLSSQLNSVISSIKGANSSNMGADFVTTSNSTLDLRGWTATTREINMDGGGVHPLAAAGELGAQGSWAYAGLTLRE